MISEMKRKVMEVNRETLKQIPSIRKEIRDLEIAVAKVQRKIDKLKNDEVCDTVKGSRDDLTIGPIKIRGHPQKEYGQKLAELQKKKALIESKRIELIRVENEAEEYIQSIQDSSLRRIIRYRYIDDLSWQQVAVRMGWRYSAESCRKRADRFMGD